MKSYVRVISGRTRQNLDVTGRVFILLQQPKKDKDGTYIVVDGSSHADMRNGRSRVYLTNGVESYEPASEIDAARIDPTAAVDEKSDEEIRQEINETFEILRDMTTAIAAGVVKGLVVSGPAGVGKSHTVEQTLREELDVMAKMRGQVSMFECFHGAMSASVLYEKLWKFKDPCNVLVFDDCDGVLYDEDALNILKAALDSKAVRQIHWNTNSYILDRKDIPNSFEYRGSIVFITNVDFTQVRSPRIQNHLEAIVSRCHYMNLGIRTVREKMIHIRNVVDKTDMLKGHGFSPEETNEIMEYVVSNAPKLREISLRSILKTADIRKAMPDRWIFFANKTILRQP